MTTARNRTNAAWLRAQVANLKFAATLRSIPSDELLLALANIEAGKAWNAVRA